MRSADDALAKRQAHVTFDSSAGGAGVTFDWTSLFEAPSETEKFAAIEALFAASGVVLSTDPERGTGGVRTEPGVTFVRPTEAGRNLVLFAPSLGHAVAALPEASERRPGGALVRHLLPAPARARRPGRARVRERVRQRAEPRGTISPSTSRVAVSLLAWARRRSTSPSRASAPPKPPGAAAEAAPPARRRCRPPPAIRRRRRRAVGVGPAGEVAGAAEGEVQGGGAGAGLLAARRGADGGGAPGQLPGGVRGHDRVARARARRRAAISSRPVSTHRRVPRRRRPCPVPAGRQAPAARPPRVPARVGVPEGAAAGASRPRAPAESGTSAPPRDRSPSTSRARAAPAPASGVDDDSVLADVLGSMELAVGQHGTAWNHVYIHMVGHGGGRFPASRRRWRPSSTSPSRICGG